MCVYHGLKRNDWQAVHVVRVKDGSSDKTHVVGNWWTNQPFLTLPCNSTRGRSYGISELELCPPGTQPTCEKCFAALTSEKPSNGLTLNQAQYEAVMTEYQNTCLRELLSSYEGLSSLMTTVLQLPKPIESPEQLVSIVSGYIRMAHTMMLDHRVFVEQQQQLSRNLENELYAGGQSLVKIRQAGAKELKRLDQVEEKLHIVRPK